MMKMIPICAILAVTCGCMVFSFGALEEETFSYTGIETVEVKGEFLAVDVSAADSPGVVMTSALPDESVNGPRHFTVKQEVVGSRLRVWVERDPLVAAIIGGGRLSFSVPQGTVLSVETVSGSASVDGLDDRQSAGGHGVRCCFCDRCQRPAGCLHRVRQPDRERLRRPHVGTHGLGRHRLPGNQAGFRLVARDHLGGDLRALHRRPRGYSFDLSSVSGALVVGNDQGGKGLRMGTGPVRVRGETVSGAQSYR